MFQNSLCVAGLTTLLALGYGLVSALWLVTVRNPWRLLLLGTAVMAVAFPPFLVANCWLHLLGTKGVLSPWIPLEIYSLWGTVWVLSLLFWPIALLLTLGAWQEVESGLLEVDPALTGGACFRWLLWPRARRALSQAGILIFVLALNNMAVPAILQTKVFPVAVWLKFNTTYEFGSALWLSMPMVIAPLLLLIWLRGGNIPWPRRYGEASPEVFRRQLGPAWVGPAAGFTVILLIVSVVLPLGEILLTSRTWSELDSVWSVARNALGNSIVYSVGAATLCLTLALLFWWVPIGLGLWIPFLLPGVVVGIAAIYLFNRPWLELFYDSAGIVIIAYTVRYIAVAWHGTAQAFKGLDPIWYEVALLYGANRLQRFRLVYWPQMGQSALVLWYITYLLCLWDVETLILIVPPGGETLASRVFNLLHYGHITQVNALCLLLLVLAVAPIGIWVGGRYGLRYGLSCAQRLSEGARSRFGNPVEWGKIGLIGLLGPILLASGLAGCAPAKGPDNAERVSIDSRLFSHVQVIGRRGTGVGNFNKPRSVAVDTEDRFYVVDMTGRVQRFSPSGKFQKSWQMPEIKKGRPKGMYGDSAGNIYVVEPHYSRINYFAPDGELLKQWGQRGTDNGKFYWPRAVVENSEQQLYVAEYGKGDRIQCFSGDDQTFLDSFGESGSELGQLNRPEGLAVDSQDRLYVADSCNHRIQIFSANGKAIRAFGQAGTKKGRMSYPYDIEIDSKGRQYVCEFGNSRIQIFSPNSQEVIEVLGGSGSAPGRLHNPWSIALDSKGNLYVADAENHRVQKFIRR